MESWTAEGSAEKMRADFAGWDPRLIDHFGYSFACSIIIFLQFGEIAHYGSIYTEMADNGPTTVEEMDTQR